MRSIEAWNECAERVTKCAERLAKYRNDKIKLKYSTAQALEKEYADLCRELPTHCPHDQTVVRYGTYTDVGYGCDRYYYHHDLYCERCKKFLIQRTDGDSRTISQPADLVDAVLLYNSKEPLSDEDLRKFGVRRHTQTTHTVTYSRT